MTLPAIRNLTIHQNTDWSDTFDILVDEVPMALTGYSIVGKVRKGEDASSDLVFSFAFNIANNIVTVSVPSSVTAALDLSNEPDQCQYFYDYVLINPSQKREKIQMGRLTLVRTVS